MTREERLAKVAELKRTLWAQGSHAPAAGAMGEHVAKTPRPEGRFEADVPAVRKVCDEFAAVLDEHLEGGKTERGPGRELIRALVPNSGWCVDTMAAALWAFNTTNSFEEGMLAAVNLGGDSDSIGAVYGQVAGAYYGFKAIPSRWVGAMKDREMLDKRIDDFIKVIQELTGAASL